MISIIDTIEPLGRFFAVQSKDVGVGDLSLDAVLNASAVELAKKISYAEAEATYAKKAEIPSVPTKTSQLLNDSGYLTQHQDLSAYAKKSEIPVVPNKVSAFTNDANYASKEYVDSHTSAGTVTSIKVGDTAYNPTSGVVSLPAYPTTLPASDVSPWAKSPNKPTYTASEVGALPSEDYDFIDVSSLSNFDISDVVDGAKMAGKMLYFPKGTTKQIDYAHSHDLVGNLCGGGNIFTRSSDNTAPDIYKMPVENIGDNIQTDMNFWSVADSRMLYPHSKYSGFLWNRELFDLDRFEYIVPWMTFTVDENYDYPEGYEIPDTTIITIKPFVVVGYNKNTHQLEHLFNIPISSGSTRNIITNVGQEGVKPTQKDGYQEYSISSDVFNDMYLHCWSGTISYLNATSRFKDVEYVGIMCEVSTNRLGIIGHLGLDQKNTSDNQGQEVGGSRFKYISSAPTNLWFSNCLNDADVYEAVQNKLVAESISDNHYISAFKKANNDRNVNTTSGTDKTKTFTLDPNSLYYILATPVSADGSMGGASDAMSALVYTNSRKAYIQPILAGNGNSSITVDGLNLTSTTISNYCLHSVIRLSAIPV